MEWAEPVFWQSYKNSRILKYNPTLLYLKHWGELSLFLNKN